MQSLLAWGADLIVAVQQWHTPLLTQLVEAFTALGGMGYLFLIPLACWCFQRRLSWQMAVIFSAAALVNFLLKDWIDLPRPYQVDPRIVSEGEHGYSLPSGHAQLVVAYWGVLAAWVARRWFWVLAVVVMGLMGFTRVYLGVHYPTDIMAGWLLGAVCVTLGLKLWPAVEHYPEGDARGLGWGVLAGITVVSCVVASLIGAEASVYGAIAFLAASGAGLLLGGGPDWRPGRWWQRVLSYVLGMTVTLLIIQGLQAAFAAISLPGPVVAAVAMILMVGWLLMLAPWLFLRLRLLEPDPLSHGN